MPPKTRRKRKTPADHHLDGVESLSREISPRTSPAAGHKLLKARPVSVSTTVPAALDESVAEASFLTQWSHETNYHRYVAVLRSAGFDMDDPHWLAHLQPSDLTLVSKLMADTDDSQRRSFLTWLESQMPDAGPSAMFGSPIRPQSSVNGRRTPIRVTRKRKRDDNDLPPGTLSDGPAAFSTPTRSADSPVPSKLRRLASGARVAFTGTPFSLQNVPKSIPYVCWEVVTSFLSASEFFIFTSTCRHLENPTLRRSGSLTVVDLTHRAAKVTDMVLGKFFGWRRVHTLSLAHCRQLTDDGLESLGVMTALRCLDLSYTQLTDECLRHVAKLKDQLLTLNVSYCTGITDVGMHRISNISSLEALELCYCSVTDAGLEPLSKLPKLAVLLLVGCKITDAGLIHLTKLPLTRLSFARAITDVGMQRLEHLKLTHIRLNGCPVTDATLARLESMPLQFVDLGASAVTDGGMRSFQRMPIRHLRLSGCNLTDSGLEQLGCLRELEMLDLSRCTNITSAGLQHLAPLSKLRRLLLTSCTKVEDIGIKHLKDLRLEYLEMGHCHITDKALSYVKDMPLVSVRVQGCNVSDAGLQHLMRTHTLRFLDVRKCNGGVSIRGMAFLKSLPGLKSLVIALHEDLVAGERERLSEDWFSLWASVL